MQPFRTHEIKETNSATEILPEKTLAFENASKEIKPVRHLSTINENLEGNSYPGTDVKYKKQEFVLNGEKVEGVFPEFKNKFDTSMPKEIYKATDTTQFKYCTEKLKEEIANNPELKKQFSPKQLEQIQNGNPKIAGLTWHHNEIPGKMQLVDQNLHATCRHTGGRCIWGGGQDFRKD